MKPFSIGMVLIGQAFVSAQSAPTESRAAEFTADRPGFATTTTVLERGVAQVESGFTFNADWTESGMKHSVVVGSPLARMGIGGRTELRWEGDGFLSMQSPDGSDTRRLSGWSDFAVEAKIAVFDQRRFLPSISLLPALSLPVGHSAFTSSGYDPRIGVAWSKDLARLSLGGLFTFASVTNDRTRSLQRGTAVSLGFPLGNSFSGCTEIYNLRDGRDQGASIWLLDGGVSRTFGRSTQIDMEMGRQLSPMAPSWFVSAGFTFRYRTPWQIAAR
jgi:hypothetical protein